MSKIKITLISAVLFLGSALIGIGSSMYVSKNITDKTFEYSKTYYELIHDPVAEYDRAKIFVKIGTRIVEGTDSNNKEDLYDLACALIELNTGNLTPELFKNEPEKYVESKAFKMKVEEIHSRLIKNGKCYKV